MTQKTITVWYYKSMRKNAKCAYKSISVWDDLHGKKAFSVGDVCEWMEYAKTYKNLVTRIEISGSHIAPLRLEKTQRFSVEQFINQLYAVVTLVNPGNMLPTTLAGLHDHPSIRYHINKYYHGERKDN